MTTEPLTESLRETLAVFDRSGAPLTTTEVAEALDLGRRSTYGRLDRLADRGRLATKKVGARGRVWWRPAPGQPTPGAAEGAVAAAGAAPAADSLVEVLDGADVGVFVLDAGGRVAWVNEATERYFGLDREGVVGRDKRALVEERIAPVVEDSAAFTEAVRSTYDGEPVSERFECRVTAGEDREARWLEHRSEPVESGQYAGGRVELYVDVTAQKRSERALDRTERRYRELGEAVEEYAIFVLDPAGRVASWNPGAERIKGYDESEILGEHFSTFYTEADRAAGVPESNLSAAAAEGSVQDEGWRVRSDGSTFWGHVTITALYDEAGHLEGFAKVTRDMTARREREREIREERALLEQILETSPVGIGIFYPDGSVDRMNARTAELLDLDEGEAETYVLGDRDVYDPDGHLLSYAERPAARVVETGEPVIDQEIRVDGPDRDSRWLSVNAAPIEDEDGDPERVVTVSTDVTQRKEQARRLERQRDEFKHELEDVFDRVADGFYGLDENLRFTYVNDHAESLLDIEESAVIGRDVRETVVLTDRFEAAVEEALERGVPESIEDYYEPLGAWFDCAIYPSETGVSVYFRDITEQKEREQELERYTRIIDAVGEPMYELDAAGRFTFVNEPFLEESGYEEEELLGRHVSIGMDEADVERVEAEIAEFLADGGRGNLTLEYDVVTGDGERVPVENRISLLLDEDGGFAGSVGVLWDITERKERERDLEKYERIVETVEDGIYVVDADGRFTMVNEAYADLTGYSREELLGAHASTVVDRVTVAAADDFERKLRSGERERIRYEADVRTADGGSTRTEASLALLPGEKDDHERVGVVRDVTERVERERELERRVRQQEVVADLGQRALEDRDLDALMADAAALVAEMLDNDYCKVLDLDADAEELLLRQGVGWHDGIVGEATVSSVEADSQAAYTLATEEPVVVEELATETRFSGPDLLTDHDVKSGISTVIGRRDDPWGILGTHDTDRADPAPNDVNFVQSVANVLAAAIARREDEHELERQREQLTALNNLNEVVNDITDAVIEQSTREEIEAIVCERLAASDSYEFAWIGDVDVPSETVNLRTEAGVEGYLDDITISVDPEDELSQGPTGRAVIDRETQVTQDIDVDRRHDPWRDHVRKYGFRSSAAIPIVHGETLYGVLNVYADRPNAFSDDEQAVVSQLGEVIGHALAAIERKRALMSEDVVELEFRARDVLAELDVPAAEGPITLERTVPIGDDVFFVYGTASGGAMETVRAAVESDALPHWTAVSVLDEDEEATRFELKLTGPPVLSTIAAHGGMVREARIADGDYYMRIHLAPSTDVRHVIDAVKDAYPSIELESRRQTVRDQASTARAKGTLFEELTDRQRAALEAAYLAGYFEWPRESTGEEVAESFDVAASTFHKHLRVGQRKLLAALFGEE